MVIFIGVSVNVMIDDNYYMKKTKKICPMCIFHMGDIPSEAIKYCPTHSRRVTKGKEEMTEEEAKNYQPFGLVGKIPWKKGGWRAITKEKKDE